MRFLRRLLRIDNAKIASLARETEDEIKRAKSEYQRKMALIEQHQVDHRVMRNASAIRVFDQWQGVDQLLKDADR